MLMPGLATVERYANTSILAATFREASIIRPRTLTLQACRPIGTIKGSEPFSRKKGSDPITSNRGSLGSESGSTCRKVTK